MATSKLDSSSSVIEAKTTSSDANAKNKSQSLIPELPDEIAELCLYRIPYPYQAQVRFVSTSWNISISHPSFLRTKNLLSLSLPHLFVSAFQKSTAKIQWQALDPQSGRWFVLPPMPSLANASSPTSFSCASLPQDGKLFVFGGMGNPRTSMQTTITYRTSTNQWSLPAPMRTPRAYSAAGNIGGKIIVAGGNGADNDDDEDDPRAELYDPENEKWTDVAKMRYKMEIYDSVVLGGKFYVTEGWRWPFMFTPRGQVYDMGRDTWEEMSEGMKEGWTGLGAVVGDRLVVISEHGDCQLKVYQSGDDTWEIVGGGEKFPSELVHRPFAVCGGVGRRICVVSQGLNVAIGRLFEKEEEGLFVEWDVFEAPNTLQHFSPFISQLLYA